MARISIPSQAQAPQKSQPLLDAVKSKLGSTPNLFRVLAHSPAALEGYLGLSNALGAGALDVRTRQRLALVVAEQNGCDYCLSAHTYLAKNLAKMDDQDIQQARQGHASDAKANAAVELAAALVRKRGQVSREEIDAARSKGLSDGDLLEVFGHVALNILTNYVNVALETDIDFPVVNAKRAA